MARRTAAVNGGHTNGDVAPQSTLAAQIVQNQTRPATSQQLPGETPNIRELLQEILHNQATVQETDLKVNAELVSVLIQAGLVPLTTGNPFADEDVLCSLAVDSMSVIEATVKRQPEVLMEEVTQDGPQLLLSLLTALIALCGKPKSEKLPLRQLLESALIAFQTSVSLWPQARTLREVIQECVDGTWNAYTGKWTFYSSHSYRPPSRSRRPASAKCNFEQQSASCKKCG